ncbi:Low-affinity inorganic phosphate transporter 1 [Burkholderiales bacterium]|nr:MAG: inorganic phosphate transporter [Burkholderiales bacterium]CAG1012484.1 Low-affinity inorganic phosphate transporter 1 [Burkholderiales bacterium]
MEFVLIGVALSLAFGNGANDNFKGFATVWGSATLGYRPALTLATLATVAGSLASLALAGTLSEQFSGRGLVPDAIAGTPGFVFTVGLAAAITVWLATRLGLPVSTTHALIGGLVGAGLGLAGSDVQLSQLAGLFLLPLLASPLLAATLGVLALRSLRLRPAEDCACVVVPAPAAGDAGAGALKFSEATAPSVRIGTDAQCRALPGVAARFSLARLADHAHIFSATLICFARGVNDTPKLAALLLAGQVLDATPAVFAIAAVMAAGGVLQARRVAVTMSRRVSRMDASQGLAANLITATLVLLASKLGLPVSTTHVSVGAIAGVGAGGGGVDWVVARAIALAWGATLPLAAAIAWLAALLLR